MTKLLHNIRFWVLVVTVGIITAVAFYYGLFTSDPFYNPLIRTYALWAAGSLYVTLLITPVITLFPGIPWKAQIVKARRATGVSVVLFACVHAYFAFFTQLGGFRGLLYLDQHYLVAVIVAAIANTIFVLMALTSFDYMVRKLGPWWKRLHRFVYLGALLVLFHALTIGSQFISLATPTNRLILLAIFLLLILEAVRFDRKWLPRGARVGYATMSILVIGTLALATFAGNTASPGLSVHSQHVGAVTNPITGAVTITVDSSKRYAVNVVTDPSVPQPGLTTTMTLTIFDSSSGNQVKQFTQLYEQFLHIIIVDSSLEHFAHIHPKTTADGTLIATYQFPTDGLYHIYFNFVPYQAPEQEVGVTIKVGDGIAKQISSDVLSDVATVKNAGAYTVTMTGTDNLNSADLSAGTEPITFSVFKADLPASLVPYVGSFGHLTLINTTTYNFIHAHPKSLTVPKPGDRSGPDVSFYPLGLYGPIKPGVYRAFAEFAPESTYTMVPFTITVH